MMDPEFWRQWLPIGISAVSLTLAGIALGWNVYRDVILKARVRVRFAIVRIVTPGQPGPGDGKRHLRVGVTNHGPGPVQIQMIEGKNAPLRRRLLRRPQYFVILNDQTNPLNPRLPHRLEVGDTLNLVLPYNEQCFLKEEATHIGVSDSFGRFRFAPRKDVKVARSQYQKDFAAGLCAQRCAHATPVAPLQLLRPAVPRSTLAPCPVADGCPPP